MPSCNVFCVSVLAFVSATVVQSARIQQKKGLDDVTVTARCSAETCTSFDEAASCSCASYLGTEALDNNLKAKLLDTVQRVRKVVDKLTPDSGAFSKFWWGSTLGQAQQQLLLLEESFEKVAALEQLVDTPVKQLASDGIELPAGTWPVMVEIWDDNALSRQIFVGETGVPFKEGDHDYVRQLRPNDQQWSVDPEGGTVSFSTSVQKSSPFDCQIGDKAMRCVELTVKVTCKSADNLPNTDSGFMGDVTDAYCKVRLQNAAATASMKLKSPVIDNTLNPRFDATFEIPPFKVPLIDPVPATDKPDPEDPKESDLVLYSIDEMTLSEQLTANIYQLGTKVFLDEDKCKPGNSHVPAICRLVQGLGSFTVDTGALEEMTSSETEPTAKKMADRLVQTSSLSQVDGVSDLTHSLMELATERRAGSMAAVMAGRRAARRRRGRGGGRRYNHGGGEGGGGILFGLLLLILVMCLLA